MIEKKHNKCYSKNVKYVRGSGFMDIMTYINQNKDLIAKPILSATGNIAAHAIDRGAKAIIDKLLAKKSGKGIIKF